jgi:Na+/glutamate symporter
MTAIFATIGALFGYMAGATQNDALLFKSEGTIRKTEASDQWNFYQAKSSKQNLAELAAITILTRQKAMGVGALAVASGSIVLGILAAAHV